LEIKWLGHSSFRIISKNGIRIIIDPYGKGRWGLKARIFKMICEESSESADVAISTHPRHWDHGNIKAIQGNLAIITGYGEQEAKGVVFRGIKSRHGSPWIMRSQNTIFCFNVDGFDICHLGDIGYPLDDRQFNEIGSVDVLFVPIGGFATVGPEAAAKICRQLNPGFIVPMHCQNNYCKFPFFADMSGFKNAFPEGIWYHENEEVDLEKFSRSVKTRVLIFESLR